MIDSSFLFDWNSGLKITKIPKPAGHSWPWGRPQLVTGDGFLELCLPWWPGKWSKGHWLSRRPWGSSHWQPSHPRPSHPMPRDTTRISTSSIHTLKMYLSMAYLSPVTVMYLNEDSQEQIFHEIENLWSTPVSLKLKCLLRWCGGGGGMGVRWGYWRVESTQAPIKPLAFHSGYTAESPGKISTPDAIGTHTQGHIMIFVGPTSIKVIENHIFTAVLG